MTLEEAQELCYESFVLYQKLESRATINNHRMHLLANKAWDRLGRRGKLMKKLQKKKRH